MSADGCILWQTKLCSKTAPKRLNWERQRQILQKKKSAHSCSSHWLKVFSNPITYQCRNFLPLLPFYILDMCSFIKKWPWPYRKVEFKFSESEHKNRSLTLAPLWQCACVRMSLYYCTLYKYPTLKWTLFEIQKKEQTLVVRQERKNINGLEWPSRLLAKLKLLKMH